MSESPDAAVERFLTEAVSRGRLTVEQADDCRRVIEVLDDVNVELTIDEVALRKGFLDRAAVTEIKRALAQRRVGRYEVLERLGSGASAVVWRARDTTLDRIVALKLLNVPAPSNDALSSYAARFRTEARTAVTLNHVNIVRGLDFGEADGYIFVAMEFVAGESLKARLERVGRLPETDALDAALQVVDALRYVRGFGLVHRDIKPENLILTPKGVLKVCDLGLAKPTLEEAAHLVGTRGIAGTPLYMAPEQIRDPAGVDWRADVYSLGATLYHLLAGQPPFRKDRDGSVIDKHLREPPADPREHALEISQGTAAVVLKMLMKDPADRYATLDALASDLDAARHARPPMHALRLVGASEGAVAEALAEAQGVRGTLRGRERRRRVAAAGVAAAIALTAWAGWELSHPSPSPASGDRRDAPVVAGTPNASPDARPGTSSLRGDDATPRDAGAAALENAQGMEDLATERDVLDQYRFVVQNFPDTPSAATAAARIVEIEAERDERARRELTRRMAGARVLADAKAYGEAVAVLEEMPADLHDTDAAEQAEMEADRLRTAGCAYVAELLERVRELVRKHEYEGAREWIAKARGVGLVAMDPAIEEDEMKALLSLRQYRESRDSQAAAFRSLRGSALLVAGADGFDAAARHLDAAVAERALDAYESELTALRSDLQRVEEVAGRLRIGWEALSLGREPVQFFGRRLPDGRVEGKPAGVRDDGALLVEGSDAEGVLAVAPRDLPIQAFEVILGPVAIGEVHERRSRFVYLLAVANFPVAREQLVLLRTTVGGDVSGDDELADARAAVARVVAREIEHGRALLAAGRVNDAAASLAHAERLLPGHAPTLVLRGLVHVSRGSVDRAEAAFVAAVAATPPAMEAHLELARLSRAREKYADAEARLLLLLEQPEDAIAAGVRADAELLLAEVRELRVLESIETSRLEASRAIRRRDFSAAVGELEGILELRPDDAEALLRVGELLVDINGRAFDAFRYLKRFLAIYPDDGQAPRARRALEELGPKMNPGADARRYIEKGRQAMARDDLRSALAAFEDAMTEGPFLVDARVGHAMALLARSIEEDSRDDLIAAARGIDDALLLDAELGSARAVLAEIELESGDPDAAIDIVSELVGRMGGREDARLMLLWGRGLLALDMAEEAVEQFDRSHDLWRTADASYWAAVARDRLGHYATALATLERMYDEEGGAPTRYEKPAGELYLRLLE